MHKGNINHLVELQVTHPTQKSYLSNVQSNALAQGTFLFGKAHMCFKSYCNSNFLIAFLLILALQETNLEI